MLSCDTFALGKDYFTGHQTFLCKNSDRPLGEAQPLLFAAAADHAPGETLRCTHLTLPQADTEDRDELTLLARRDVLVQDNIYTLEERAGSFRYDAEYYDMRAPWLAKWLADDFARYDARGIFSSRTYRITSLDLPALDADTAYCYFLQDTRRGHYWGHRVIVQKGCKVISADIWWTYDRGFPAETFARALLTAISE